MNLRGIPTWLRITAASVLGLIVLLIACGFWLRSYLERMVDPEVQWAEIRKVIAVDEPPPPYGVLGMPSFLGMNGWGLSEPAGGRFGMFLREDREDAAKLRKEMFDPETRELPGKPPGPAMSLEHGTIAVQGRDLRCVRFAYEDPREHARRNRSGPTILVELPREDPGEFLAFVMIAEGEGSRVEDAQVVDFLKPFHVGPDR